MSTQSDAMPEASPAATSRPRTRPLFWSIRRELWENHAIWIAPLAVAGVIIFGFTVSIVAPHRFTSATTVHRTTAAASQPASQTAPSTVVAPPPGSVTSTAVVTKVAAPPLTPAQHRALVALPFNIVALTLICTMFVVAVFYCLGAMHNERRDRSILFWKSLPVPDLTTVVAKAIVPLAILPVVTLVVTIGTQLIMLAMGLADLTAHGKSTDPALSVPLAEMSVVLLYALTTLTLWWAPVYGWLLLVSVWARRAPFLWAVLPPVAVAIAEKVAFGTNRIGDTIMLRLIGGAGYAFESPPRGGMRPGMIPTIGVDQIDAGKFFSSPDLWIGLFVAAALLAATVWLRRDREPI